ncbi:hypothetical protein CVT26_008995 [Gymnopilus dilepis]|uniref:Uncharacterized protein n=1 Tax=Gymnopilus dilepis TaxID=231916 RepID=A0A409YB62_9AGAR|nr:hypothetical protein CVT26_008995 [Gymnopilus dilepis]
MGPPYVTPTPTDFEEAHILVGGRGENHDGGGRRRKRVVEGRRESGINDAQAVDPVSAFAGQPIQADRRHQTRPCALTPPSQQTRINVAFDATRDLKFELLVRTSLVFIPPPDPPPSPLSCLRFPSTSAASSGVHVDSWAPVMAGHPSHRETHGVTWQRPTPLRPTTLTKYPLSLSPPSPSPSKPPPPSASSTTCPPPPSRMPLHPPRGCRPRLARRWVARRKAHVVTWRLLLPLHAPSLASILNSAGANAPRRRLSLAMTISRSGFHCCITDATLVGSSTLPGAACDVAAASTVLSCLANPGLAHFELSLKHLALERLPGLSSHCDIVL